MFRHVSQFVSNHWVIVIGLWVVATVLLVATAPRWSDVTHDGEFAYLPADMPSVIGRSRLREAYPERRANSQIAVAVVNNSTAMQQQDISIADDLARRLLNLHGEIALTHADKLFADANQAQADDNLRLAEEHAADAEAWLELAKASMRDAAMFDARFVAYWTTHAAEASLRPAHVESMPEIFRNRSRLWTHLGEHEKAILELARAKELSPSVNLDADPTYADIPILDVWTWRDPDFGKKLISEDHQARLILLHLSSEFIAVDNISVVEEIERHIAAVQVNNTALQNPDLQIVITGSAVVGTDMLRSSVDSIRHTEIVTVILVIGFLAIVYRSPILVFIPLVSIGVSFVAATALIAHLTQVNHLPGFGWWDLKVFTTTRVFIVVILFGAGTDYCLFLIARFREELRTTQDMSAAVSGAMQGVGSALAASALTTIVGLGMMFFADFGKFQSSGIVIGLALSVTLLACLTIAPALLRAAGPLVFWPTKPEAIVNESQKNTLSRTFWDSTARHIAKRPRIVLIAATAALLIPGIHGWLRENAVTYDIMSALSDKRPSKVGSHVLQQHFPIGESGPIVVIAHKPDGDFSAQEEKKEIQRLGKALRVTGVSGVRSIADPLGTHGTKRIGLLSGDSWTTWITKTHPRSEALFTSKSGEFRNRVTRFELVLRPDPFSADAIATLQEVGRTLKSLKQDSDYWSNVEFSFAGITANMRDLKTVTQSDQRRIQFLVVVAVLAVLIVILKRPLTCAFMIVTVLLSYFAALGLTDLFFGIVVGSDYQGLDWKVPLFLFVILVAIGQDYNVYLATRVFEEQERRGPFAGLREAIVSTGGIITSCGIIMAGTFISMTCTALLEAIAHVFPQTASWLPASQGPLLGITQLGFALSLGVLLDTFIVRSVMVPAILALLSHYRIGQKA